MEINALKNNELITGISVLAVLKYATHMEVSKSMLIEPLLSYTKVLQLLCRSNSSIKSVEDLIIKESIVFANFNERYKEKLALSINAILLFDKLHLLTIKNNEVIFTGDKFGFDDPTLGEKAKSRIAASRNLANILAKGETSDLYMSLRVEI
jgi:hypothetical protein